MCGNYKKQNLEINIRKLSMTLCKIFLKALQFMPTETKIIMIKHVFSSMSYDTSISVTMQYTYRTLVYSWRRISTSSALYCLTCVHVLFYSFVLENVQHFLNWWMSIDNVTDCSEVTLILQAESHISVQW